MRSKYNPHKACGCRSCRLGAGTAYGQHVHRAGNRKMRHEDKLSLKVAPLDYASGAITSTPFTD